jgi:predicted HTH domain antitoxin
MNINIEIPEEFARSFGETEADVTRNAKIELAIQMYREGKWTTLRAGQFTAMTRWEFMNVLKTRKIEVPYTKEMLQQDIEYAFGQSRS